MSKKSKPFLAHSEITDCIYIIDGHDKYEVTEQCIKAMKATNRIPRLIPVSEKLPEQDRKDEAGNDVAYLIQTECGTFFTATYDGNWCHVDSSVLVESDVVAWMPLPEPYKAEGSEE